MITDVAAVDVDVDVDDEVLDVVDDVAPADASVVSVVDVLLVT